MTDTNSSVNDAKSAYVGNDRVNKIHQYAIDVSSQTREQVSRAAFMRHLLDHYAQPARATWLLKLTEAQAQPAQTAQALDIKPHALVTGDHIYIGSDYFKALKQLAIDISGDIRIQITPSQAACFLIDHFSTMALAEWQQTLDVAATSAHSKD